MDPQEGDVAEDGNGNYLVYRGGDWYPSQEDGRPRERIPRPDYGANHFQLPNGDIVRQGPRGGQETVENFGGAGGGSGGSAMVSADQRGRYNIGANPLVRAERNLAVEEAGGNPLNRDWGAVLLNGVDLDPRGDSSFRPFAPLANLVGGQDFQNTQQALSTYEASLMPIQSGASVTASEAARQIRADFPSLGDSEETLRRKAANRMDRINAILAGIGKPPAFTPEMIADPSRVTADQEAQALAGLPVPAPASGAGAPDGAPPTPGPTPGGVAPGEYDASYVAQWDRDGDNRASVDEMLAAGFTYDNQAGQWKPPTGRSGEPIAPDGAREQAAAERSSEGTGFIRKIDTVAGGVLDGLSLGFGDEIGAGISSIVPFENSRGGSTVWQDGLGAFDQNLGVIRGRNDADAAQLPFTRGAGQVAGGVASAFIPIGAAGRAAQGASFLGRVGAGAKAGAAVGAAYGAGSAEGNALQRAQGAGTGAAIGAVAGAAAPVVAPIVGRAISPAANALGDGIRAITRPAVNALGERGVPIPDGIRNLVSVNALDRGLERFAGTVRPDVAQMGVRGNALSEAVGRPIAAADTLNSGGRAGLRGIAMRSDQARQTATDFAAGRAEALPANLGATSRSILGASDVRAPAAIQDGLAAQRSSAAREAYPQVYAQTVEVPTEVSAALSGTPGRAAIQRARAAAEAWQEADTVAELDGLVAALADGSTPSTISVGALDRIRQAMSGRGEQLAQRPGTRAVGTGLQQRALQVDGALEQVPGMAEARGPYRELSNQIRASEVGEQFLGSRPDEVAAAMSNASPEAQAAFRASAARAIEQAAGTTGAAPGVANKLAVPGTPQRQMMDATLGPDDAARLAEGARAERDLLNSAREVSPGTGSQTASNLDAMAQAGGLVADVATGQPLNLMSKAVNLLNRRGFTGQQAEAVISAMTDPARTEEVISILAQRMSRREARNLARALRFQAISASQ